MLFRSTVPLSARQKEAQWHCLFHESIVFPYNTSLIGNLFERMAKHQTLETDSKPTWNLKHALAGRVHGTLLVW